MDANRLRFWMLSDGLWPGASATGGDPDWQPITADNVRFDAPRRRLLLASRRDLPAIADDGVEATARLALVPGAVDAFGTWAYWNASARKVMGTGAVPGEVPIFTPGPSETPTDIVVGYDGAIYVAVGGGVVVQDLRGRWDPVRVSAPSFSAWRLAADPQGGVWALGGPPGAAGASFQIARLRGLPLPRRIGSGPGPNTFRLRDDNPTPPRLGVVATITLADERPVALAVSPGGIVGVLVWHMGADARLYPLAGATLGAPTTLAGARFPYSVAWLSEDRVAVLLSHFSPADPALHQRTAEAIAYPIAGGEPTAPPVGDLYPLRGHDRGPFLHGTTLPPQYGTASGPSPLYPVSLPSLPRSGTASNRRWLDSGSARTVWHRLYLEAVIPPGTGVRVLLAATDEAAPPPAADVWAWCEHRFGAVPPSPEDPPGTANPTRPRNVDVPRGVWVSTPSEVPFHDGLLGCPAEPHRSGLFTALIQRPTRAVRALRGRYLWARVDLLGDGRAGPEIAALRAYASRFSYAEHYLPELFRESVFGDDADARGAATPADFLERLLDNCEGVLTPLEDRIAGSWMLTDPRRVPEESLEWLASWIGFTFDPVVPVDRRRQMLEAAPELSRWRGTLRGLTLALDVATGGAVSAGRVVVVEDFRLRRTFATILGADLSDPDDPLLPGLTTSGNSIVGDTLFLGDAMQKELLAIFAKGLLDRPVQGASAAAQQDAERQVVEAFFERLAHRATVLVHQEIVADDLGLIRRVADAESPAHVSVAVTAASNPFIVGVASLVGVDTYLAQKTRPQPVQVGGTRIGVRDVLERPPTLDPRTEGGSG
jgi:phage tail-like protein